MKGRRLPVGKSPGTFTMPTEPGDYCGPVKHPSEDVSSVYFLLPIVRDPKAPPGARAVHRVASPPHVFRECADGSLEIRESIGCGPSPYYWHGYLDEGHEWRQV